MSFEFRVFDRSFSGHSLLNVTRLDLDLAHFAAADRVYIQKGLLTVSVLPGDVNSLNFCFALCQDAWFYQHENLILG